jgi:hypothetical protein
MPLAAPTITTRELNRATLARQMLLERADATPLAAVERLAGLQAQQARPPHIGLWTRLAGYRSADLLEALRRREVVRVTAMRATLHLLRTRDYTTLRGALQPSFARSLHGVTKGRDAAFDVADLVAAGRAFFGERGATFDALRAHLKERYPGFDERELAYAIRLHVPLVQLPTDARWGFPAAADFACAETWLQCPVPTAPEPARAQALVRRYLAAFGPASVADAAAWSGLGVGHLRDAFDALRPGLIALRDANGRTLYDLAHAPRPPADTPAPVRFLPEYDNLLLAHADRTRIVADAHRARLVTKNLIVPATFLVDGVVAGTWRIETKGKAATLVIAPFGRVAKRARAALEREGAALLRFVAEDAKIRGMRWEG